MFPFSLIGILLGCSSFFCLRCGYIVGQCCLEKSCRILLQKKAICCYIRAKNGWRRPDKYLLRFWFPAAMFFHFKSGRTYKLRPPRRGFFCLFKLWWDFFFFCFCDETLQQQLFFKHRFFLHAPQFLKKNTSISGVWTHAHVCGFDLKSNALDHSAMILFIFLKFIIIIEPSKLVKITWLIFTWSASS